MSFDALPLAPAILRAVAEAGYTTPSPIQAQAIPEALAGHDLIASAQTGTGKTAAFMLPALHRLSQQAPGPRILVLTPTRELATQVADAARKYGKHLRFRTALLLGGMPYGPQLKALSAFPDLIIATPGRLIDHLERGRLDLSRIEMLVLDEADRMLDLGFKDDVEAIAAATPTKRQTLLFTATMDATMARLAQALLREPVRIEISAPTERHTHIEQRLHVADNLDHKERLLDHLVSDEALNRAIVFTATKRDADLLADRLRDAGHSAAALHGDMPQAVRNRTLSRLREGRVRLLVATDVAARGIDISDLSHVINFDLPHGPEDYVHRIGRTGRAGREGTAISLVVPDDVRKLDRIERYTGQALAEHVIEGLEPTRPLRRRPAGRRDGDSRGYRSGPPRRHGGGYSNGPRREGGGYNRDGNRSFSGERREGGFNRDNGNRGFGERREGGFNRDGGNRSFSGERRGGGFNRDGGNRNFGERREGGFNRDGNRGFGGERREGTYNADAPRRPRRFDGEAG